MNKLTFEIPGNVQPQQRPKAATRGKVVTIYDPKESKEYKKYVAAVAEKYALDCLITQEIKLTIDVYRPLTQEIIKSHNKLTAAINGTLRPTKKPDIDNLVKGIKDGITNVIWKDDSQVTELIARKWYGESPKAVVTIEWESDNSEQMKLFQNN